LATLFNNPTYTTIFSAFSRLRPFGPVGGNVTDSLFFVPGTSSGTPAVVEGFGAVFTDVDQPNGSRRRPSTQLDFFGEDGGLIFRGVVPASPGDASQSFFGVVFPMRLSRYGSPRATWLRCGR
jgi:hypothetical protein